MHAYNCKANKEPITVGLTVPRGKPTTMILLNGRSTKLPPKPYLYRLMQLLDLIRAVSLCRGWTKVQRIASIACSSINETYNWDVNFKRLLSKLLTSFTLKKIIK